MKTVFLDFDGVLFDTLKEAYVLCRYAYLGVDVFEPVDEAVYKLFYRYKFLVYNSWQYYYVMKLLTDGIRDDNLFINMYQKYMNNRDKNSEEIFDDKYLKMRIELMDKYSDFWNKLEEPFPFFYEIKQLYETNAIDVIIVSKKNKIAIQKRLKQYCLEIDNDKIFAKEELLPFSSKAEFIHKYMKDNNIRLSYFVDDNSNNIKPCLKYKNIRAFLAGWGNIAIGEKGLTVSEIVKELKS